MQDKVPKVLKFSEKAVSLRLKIVNIREMRRILYFVLLALFCLSATAAMGQETGFGGDTTTFRSSVEPLSKKELRKLRKQQRKERLRQQVQQALADRYFTIDVDRIYPMRGNSRTVNGFWLTVHGDSIYSYLPYFGAAYYVPFGGGKGYDFDSIISYYEESHPQEDLTRIVLFTETDEDQFRFTIEVWDTGTADIHAVSRNRDQVTWDGQLDLPDDD